MESFEKFISKFVNAKGIVILLIVVLLIFFIIRNLDFITEITFKIDKSKKVDTEKLDSIKRVVDKLQPNSVTKKDSATSLKIEKINLCPQSFRMPSYFYLEIKNTGGYIAHNVTVSIDFGKSKYDSIEFKPELPIPIILSLMNERNLFKIKFPEVLPNQNIYIYSFIDLPIFKEITVFCENTKEIEDINYQQFLNRIGNSSYLLTDEFNNDMNESKKNISFFDTSFGTFLQVLAALIIIAFSFLFVYISFTLLLRFWKIDN